MLQLTQGSGELNHQIFKKRRYTVAILEKLLSLFQFRSSSLEEDEYIACPECEGTGEFDTDIACEYCDGKGKIEETEYYEMLTKGDFEEL